jgi:tRNA U34 2-thiouridine synthase MnmA/TrmU
LRAKKIPPFLSPLRYSYINKQKQTDMKKQDLPKGAIEIENRYGRMYPLEDGYYGFIVGDRPAMHIYQMRKYTIDIFNNGEFINTIVCEHGEF